MSQGESSFSRCTGLIRVNYNAIDLKSSPDFQSCTSIKQFRFSDKVETIPDNLCKGLALNITLPNVKTIGETAFYNSTKLSTLILGCSVESIGSSAFNFSYNYNNSLERIVSLNTNPPYVENRNFIDIESSATLYVPTEAIDRYKTDSFWSKFCYIEGGAEDIAAGLLDVAPDQPVKVYGHA